MKNLLLALFLFSAVSVLPQEGWFWQNPLPHGNTISSVDFIDVNNGISVGERGSVSITTNGGFDWTLQNSQTSYDLWSVHFLRYDLALAFGDNGVFLKSTDGGITWQKRFLSPISNLTSASFIDDNIGWVYGPSLLYKTTDGGESWVSKYPGIVGISAISFASQTTGFVCTNDGRVMKSTDGGNSWTTVLSTPNPLISVNYYEIFFVDSLNGFISGYSVQYGQLAYKTARTTDGGTSWTNMSSATNYDRLTKFYFLNKDIGFAIGGPNVFKTINGGVIWQKINLGIGSDYTAVTIVNPDNIYISGKGGEMIRSMDGGSSWSSQLNGYTWTHLNNVDFVNSQKGWVAGNSGCILHSSDGGTNWEPQSAGTLENILDIQFIDETSGFAAGGNGTFLRTTDGGVNWQKIIVDSAVTLQALFFVSMTNGWLAGRGGKIYSTIDSGSSWTLQNSGITIDMKDIFFVGENTGWAIASKDWNNWILKTTNAGLEWVPFSISTSTLKTIYFVDELTGWITEYQGVLKTTNSGQTWIHTQINNEWPRTVYFLNPDTGFVASENGDILHSTDGGATWTKKFSNTGNALWGIDFVDPSTGWVVGDYSNILKTSNGGISSLAVNGAGIPQEFSLSQNYPNPFNPTTVISYQLPVNSNVSLRLYDILGNEIATLVDEEQPAGNHEYKLTSLNYKLSSGIYFYQLRAGTFVTTKKMVLLK
ncbi:MAG: YCF48-related protein [Ignavibacteriaceae bacterium]